MTTVIINEKSKKKKIVDDRMVKKKVKRNIVTLNAIKNAYDGKTIKCDDFQNYLQKVV